MLADPDNQAVAIIIGLAISMRNHRGECGNTQRGLLIASMTCHGGR